MADRERDCDEAVLMQGSRPGDYARGIVHVCEAYVELAGVGLGNPWLRFRKALARSRPGADCLVTIPRQRAARRRNPRIRIVPHHRNCLRTDFTTRLPTATKAELSSRSQVLALRT